MGADIYIGRLVAGKYELVRLIGKGAMGEVWLASHNTLGGEFAVKLVKPRDEDQDESAAGRFQLEAQISAKLSRRTRHIVSVSDHGEELDGLAYLVMELLEGESLEQRIERSVKLSLVETVAIVVQVARALEQAHSESIFHRDLKPANIFLTKDEDGRLLVKLLDFGIARSSKPVRTRSKFATGKDMVLGTPSYMSPEQARGLDTLDHRCDLWAMAVVAFEALTGEIPWEGESVEDIFLAICTFRVRPIAPLRPDLPPLASAIFERSFAPNLVERFNTAMELSAAFEDLVDPLEVESFSRGATSQRRMLASMPGGGRPGSIPDYRPRASSDHDLAVASGMSLQGPRPNATNPRQAALGPTAFMQRTNRGSGWIVAGIVAVATIVLILFGLKVLSARNTAAATERPAASTPETPAASSAPLSNQTPPPTPSVTTIAPEVKSTRPVSRPVAQPVPKPAVAPPPVTAPVIAAPPPPPPPPVEPPPTPKPAPTPTTQDRGGVF